MIPLSEIRRLCVNCNKENTLDKMFRCACCGKICCDKHVEGGYAICPKCQEDDKPLYSY